MKNVYVPRLFDKTLSFLLTCMGAVLVSGPKGCGKSTTCSRFAKEIIDFTDEIASANMIKLATLSPSEFLKNRKKPLLIDEWQIISFIWNNIKLECDKSNSFGNFILTGSVNDINAKNDPLSRHTGSMRIVKKVMRTMSLFESKDSNGLVSLSNLKDNKFNFGRCDKTLNDYAYYICRGGWPLSLSFNDEKASLYQAKAFFTSLVSEDMFSIKDLKIDKNEQRVRNFFRSYARNISSQCADNVIIDDFLNEQNSMANETFLKYMEIARRLYIIDELEAWNPNLRSKIAIRSKNTRHFFDPSIGASALGLTPLSLFKDMNTFGLLFEDLVIRDLRVYADVLDAKIYHYRDRYDNEIDAVIVFDDGNYGLIEIKLGTEEEIDNSAKKLLKLKENIFDNNKEASFLLIITAKDLAYQREDGVYIAPLGTLTY